MCPLSWSSEGGRGVQGDTHQSVPCRRGRDSLSSIRHDQSFLFLVRPYVNVNPLSRVFTGFSPSPFYCVPTLSGLPSLPLVGFWALPSFTVFFMTNLRVLTERFSCRSHSLLDCFRLCSGFYWLWLEFIMTPVLSSLTACWYDPIWEVLNLVNLIVFFWWNQWIVMFKQCALCISKML